MRAYSHQPNPLAGGWVFHATIRKTNYIRMKRLITISLLFLLSVSVSSGQDNYRPASSKSKDNSYFKKGKVNIIPSSHQDIAWMDSIGACEIWRDEKMLTPVLNILERNPNFRFTCECSMELMEYLKRHPDKLKLLHKYTREGRIEWGATYNNPYESMYDGEALVRQVYLGKKWLQKQLPGCSFTSAFNEDVPGRALQMPQILAKAGIDYLHFSRHEPGIYNWYSPDGSKVLAFTPGQYYQASYEVLESKTDSATTQNMLKYLKKWNDYFKQNKLAPNLPFLYSLDWSEPKEFTSFLKLWNENHAKTGLPEISFATGSEALMAVKSPHAGFEKIVGERPEVWLYIHGATHEKALTASRNANRMLISAEKLATTASFLENSFERYPQGQFNTAWLNAIYPDHGWGGKHGDLTDLAFRRKFETALDISSEIVKKSVDLISKQIKFSQDGLAVVVFNTLSWQRTDLVKVNIDAYGQNITTYRVIDASTGKEIPSQQISSEVVTSKEPVSLTFVAEDVPSMGYKTYYLKPIINEIKKFESDQSTNYWMQPVQPTQPSDVNNYSNGQVVDNKYYRVEFSKGGIKSIFDKQLQKELLSSGNLLGGEIFQLESVGNGAGEFTDIQPVSMNGFEKVSQYAPTWNCSEFGAVRKAYEFTQQTKFAAIKEKVILYENLKKIDFEIDILGFSGEHYREYRIAFPLNQTNSAIAYEVPMGVVEVGKSEIKGAAGFSKPDQIYNTECARVHPREVQDWFNASSDNVSVNIGSSVATFDWVDPTNSQNQNPVLQGILLASRRSCHGEGNFYLQPGNHHYSFSLSSLEGSWKNFVQKGKQSNCPLIANVIETKKAGSGLPEEAGFIKVDAGNVLVTTWKKADDDNSYIFRLCEMTGSDTNVTVNLPSVIKKLWHTDIIEENGTEIQTHGKSFSLQIGHNAIETFKVQF